MNNNPAPAAGLRLVKRVDHDHRGCLCVLPAEG